MGKIKVLDCTLRDGGYINNWKFGVNAICDICKKNEIIGADVIELGFLRDLKYDRNIALFSSLDQLEHIVGDKKSDIKYAVMAEMGCYYPWEKMVPRNATTFDMIRYVFWKRCMQEGIEYCKRIKERGYDLAVQPTRVEQYNEAEFSEMLLRFGELEPYAIYIVDTFGLLTKDKLIRYAQIADRCLDKNIILGYHAHNNMQQAFGNAAALVELKLDRDVMLDVSAFGMGRGAGNLNSEIFLNFLNQNYGTQYDTKLIYMIWDLWLKDIYTKNQWGYSLYYYISAYYKANPNYATYFADNSFSVAEADRLMEKIPYDERIVFSEKTIEKYMEMDE